MKKLQTKIVFYLVIVCLYATLSQAQNFDKKENIELTNMFVTETLERVWNYLLMEKVFLGPTYFGNTTTFGRDRDTLHACQWIHALPTYRALAAKGLLKLEELDIADASPAAQKNCSNVKRAADVSLLPLGAKLGEVDEKKNTVTFVFARCRMERITGNTHIQTSRGIYRLVEGEFLFTVNPDFSDVLAEIGAPIYTHRHFRAIFAYEGHNVRDADGVERMAQPEWQYTASDIGPQNGPWESEDVPSTLRDIRGTNR